jgi:hypothetical protein
LCQRHHEEGIDLAEMGLDANPSHHTTALSNTD